MRCGSHRTASRSTSSAATTRPRRLRTQPPAEELGRGPAPAAAMGRRRPRARHPGAGRLHRPHRPRRQNLRNRLQRLSQPVRLRHQRRRRALHLRRRHGMGHGHAVVSPDAAGPRHQRQRIRLAQRHRQVAGLLRRQSAADPERSGPAPPSGSSSATGRSSPPSIRRRSSVATGPSAPCMPCTSNRPARPTRA